MKVLHINSDYVNSIFYKELYDRQDFNSEIEICVYCPTKLQYNNTNNIDFGDYSIISNLFGRLDRLLFYPKHKKILKDVVKKIDVPSFDIIHAHSLFSNGLIAYWLYRKYKTPYIVAVRNTDVNLFFEKLFFMRGIGLNILRNAYKIIFISSAYKQLVLSRYIPSDIFNDISNKCEVIPNGINDFWYKNTPAKHKCIDKDGLLRILYVGEVNANKNLLTTVRAIQSLKKHSIIFNVVGKISDKYVYEELIKNKFVKYWGTQNREELLETYRANDIFIMPSIHETFGLVYAEAISQGLPVIYSQGQGFDCWFQDGEIGCAVEATNYKELARKIEDILIDYENISKRCIYMGKSFFDWQDIANKYDEIYHTV